MNKRTFFTMVVILTLAAGGYFGYSRFTASAQTNAATLQIAPIERGTLMATVNAAGTIAAPQSAALAWRTTGVVGAVHVAVGDIVKAGDVMLELDPASLDRTMIQAQADLIAAQQALADLLAGPSVQQLAQAQLAVVEAEQALDTLLTNPMAQQLAQAQLAVAQARDTLKDVEYRRRVQQEGYRASADTIAAAEANLVLAEDEVKRAQKRFNKVANRSEYDPMRARALLDLTATRQKRDSVLRNLNWTTGQPGEIDQAILDAEVALAEAELAVAEQELVDLEEGSNPAEVALAEAELAVAEQELVDLKEGLDPAEVAAAEVRVAAVQATLDLMRLVAPFDGTVVAMQNQVGDYINNNTIALTLADLRYEVQVDVSELDVNSIFVGQEAVLILDAAPGQTFSGHVADVAFLGSVNQGVVSFSVTVVVDDPDPALKPGMTAAVSIVTDRRENVLMVPNRAVQVSGGQRTITVLFEGTQIAVPVTLGLTGDTMSEVVEGALREGDAVVINLSTTTQGGFVPGRGGFFGSGGGGFGGDH